VGCCCCCCCCCCCLGYPEQNEFFSSLICYFIIYLLHGLIFYFNLKSSLSTKLNRISIRTYPLYLMVYCIHQVPPPHLSSKHWGSDTCPYPENNRHIACDTRKVKIETQLVYNNGNTILHLFLTAWCILYISGVVTFGHPRKHVRQPSMMWLNW
jgi:hypothetical protein